MVSQGFTSCLFFRVGTATGLQRGEDQPDKERKSQLASRPEPRPLKALGGDGRSARHRLAELHGQAKQAMTSVDVELFSGVSL